MRIRQLLIAASLASLLLAGLLAGSLGRRAEAHGKEISVTVVSLVPDASQPLRRLYRVEAVYASDLDPVHRGTVVLSAALRRDGELVATLEPAPFVEVGGEPGVYVGEIVFSRFGNWDVNLRVEAELGQGDGESSFVEELTPGALTDAQEAALREEGQRVYELQLFFGFDWWPDVVNVISRITHSMAGLAYFAGTAGAFTIAWIGLPAERRRLADRFTRLYPFLAFGSLAVLLGAGLYSAAFDAPITSPGIYDVDRMLEIPYGDWYLAAFAVKVILFGVLVALAFRTTHHLRDWHAGMRLQAEGSAAVEGALRSLRRTTATTGIVGVLVIADVAVLIYMHYISHLGVFLPE